MIEALYLVMVITWTPDAIENRMVHFIEVRSRTLCDALAENMRREFTSSRDIPGTARCIITEVGDIKSDGLKGALKNGASRAYESPAGRPETAYGRKITQ